MSTVLKIGSIIFFFTSYDCYEPTHIHVVNGRKECKYRLRGDDQIILADNSGVSRNELLKLRQIIRMNFQLIKKSCDEHCQNTSKKDTKSNRQADTFAEMPVFEKIVFDSNSISFKLSDNRIITIPLAWIPKLESADNAIREDYILRGHFAFWERIDEISGVSNLLNGSIVPK